MKNKVKQNILEVIAYLLEAPSLKGESLLNQTMVKRGLESVGFSKEVVEDTFEWLKSLIEQQCVYVIAKVKAKSSVNKTLRVFSIDEKSKISLEVRSFIFHLEQIDILDTRMREIVIGQLLQLDKCVSLTDAKWVVLLVLISKLNKDNQEVRNYLLAITAKGNNL